MTVKTRVEPIADFVGIAVSDMLSPKARSKVIADFARGALTEAQQTNQRVLGRIPPHETFVDGRKGGSLESVNPDRGVIVFEFELLADVLIWIARALQEASPVVSGAYRRAHTLFADGKETAVNAKIPPASEYSFTNYVPYARKLEIGRTKSGRPFVIQVSPRIYERVAKAARARFGNMVKIEFTYRGLIGHASGSGTLVNPGRDPTRGARSRGKNGRFTNMGGPKAYNVSKVRYPTINVTPR